jgi:hypothetical protein
MTATTLPQAELQKRGYATRPLPVTAAASVASDVAKTRDQQCTDVRGSCPVADGSTMPHTSWQQQQQQQQQQQKENQKHRKNVVELHYDAVIAGSGAGGGVTAAVLAAAGLRVLVLEQSSWVKRDGVCVCVVYGGCVGCLGGGSKGHIPSRSHITLEGGLGMHTQGMCSSGLCGHVGHKHGTAPVYHPCRQKLQPAHTPSLLPACLACLCE